MTIRSRLPAAGLAFAAVLALAGDAAAQVYVYRVGNGETLANTGNAAFIDRFAPTGSGQTAVTTAIPVPTTTNSGTGLVNSGTATSEGALALSPNGQAITFIGYNAVPGGTTSLTGTTSTAVNRIIGQFNVGTSAVTFPVRTDTAYTGNNPRSAVTDGTNYYGAGGASGTVQFTANSAVQPGTPIQTANANTRVVAIQNGNLTFATGAGTRGIYTFTGSPTAAATATLLIATGASSSPYGYAISPNQLVAYVADDTANIAGGIQKYTRATTADAFTIATTFGTGVANIGARGLAVDFSGANPVIYATTAEATANRTITLTDDGSANPIVTTLGTAPTGAAFRGLAFVPVPEPATVLLAATAGLGVARLARRRLLARA